MELKEAIEKIEHFRELKQNWNGYGAEPFSDKVINKALGLVKQLKPIPEVFPTPRNSIQLEWEVDGLYLEIEVFEDEIHILNQSEHGGEVATIGGEE